MEPELRELLRGVANESNGESHTHVTLFSPHARWNIKPEKLQDFYIGYCDILESKSVDPYCNINLAEKPQEFMPLINKFTFKFHNNDDEVWEPYDDEFLAMLVMYHQQAILEHYRLVNECQMELLAIVLESATHWYEDDGKFMLMEVRIQFPYAKFDVGGQSRKIRPRIIELLRNGKVMAKLGRQPIGDWEQILSNNIINEPIVMYGSTESPGRPKLKLGHIWHTIDSEMLENHNLPPEINLGEAFVPQYHYSVASGAVSKNIFDEELEYWLPLFLSVNYEHRILLPIEEQNHNKLRNVQPQQEHIFGSVKRSFIDDDVDGVELAETMLGMINNERYMKELTWLDIGKALYYVNDGTENGLNSWIHHTKRALNGNDNIPEFMLTGGTLNNTCTYIYHTFAENYITEKTLAWYAREDNPQQYADWHMEWCTASMEKALSGTHTDVAHALYRVYWLDFNYYPISQDRGTWFHFKNHRHFEDKQGIDLRKLISGDFVKRFEFVRMILSRQVHEANDQTLSDSAEITHKKIGMLINNLKNVGFKSSLVTATRELFNNPQFVGLLDKNPDLTGVKNGVLEIQGNFVQFRAAKPEDYISMCTNVPYKEDFTWDHPLVKECMKWIGQIFTDKSLQHHFLKFSASTLKGRNSDKIFPIMTGEGDNSKSMLVKLFETVYGVYCIKFDISNITNRNGNASGPSPQLARARGTKLLFIDEPDDDIPMHKGPLKRYIGGDSFFGRLLNDNGGDIVVTFKLILTCNKVPLIPNADKAIKNRTRLFPFMSTWVDNPPEDENEQYRQRKFKKNPFFEQRIPILSPAFLWIIANYYPHYATEKLEDPDIVKEHTEAYWRDNDMYAQFASEHIKEVYTDDGDRDPNARVTLTEIYNEFKTWYRDSFPGNKIPERTIVRAEFTSRWGRMNGNAWLGISMVESGPTPTSVTTGMMSNLPRKLPLAKPKSTEEELKKALEEAEVSKKCSPENNIPGLGIPIGSIDV